MTAQERLIFFGIMHFIMLYERWCADSWDTVEQFEPPPMQSLVKALEPSGWIMWPVLAQSHPWTDVPSVDGASTTVCIVKMQEWCVKVGWYVYCVCVHV